MVAVVFVAVLFGLQNARTGAEKKTVPPYRAESSAYAVRGKDAWTYVTENRSFRFAEVLGDTGITRRYYFWKKPIAMNALTA